MLACFSPDQMFLSPSYLLPVSSWFHHLSQSILYTRGCSSRHWKHTFNYPWPHISLKYGQCAPPQGERVHDLSPDLFMCHLWDGSDLMPLSVICTIYFVFKSRKSCVKCATRHGCQIEVLSGSDVACLCGWCTSSKTSCSEKRLHWL